MIQKEIEYKIVHEPMLLPKLVEQIEIVDVLETSRISSSTICSQPIKVRQWFSSDHVDTYDENFHDCRRIMITKNGDLSTYLEP